MRSLPARVFSLMFVALTIAVVQGCASTADPAGGGGATTYGAEVTPDPASEGDTGDDGEPDSALVAVDDSANAGDGANVGTVHETLIASSQMRTTANLNFRKGAGTTYAVIAVIPSGTLVTLVNATPQNGFLNIAFNGTNGWSSATYLTAVTSTGGGGSSGGSSGGSTGGTVNLDGPTSPDNAFARAKAAVGFSYYWGGGAWQAVGATSSNKGSCSGSCPSCSHSGKYGADCSGLVAKAWQFGAEALETNSHPYSTSSFVNDSSGHWSTVSRASLKKGDALVYNTGSAGHIVLYEKGDGWGTPTVVECRGCAYGCVYDARSFSSTYHGIRRAGF